MVKKGERMVKVCRYYLFLVLVSIASVIYGIPANLSVAKCKVENYYECGKYNKQINKIVDKAIKHFAKVACPSEKTVIFDIDDTALSTFAVVKSIKYGYVDKITDRSELCANLPGIPATRRLYNFILDRGFHTVFLTGRAQDKYEATKWNLEKQGFTNFEAIIMREPHEIGVSAQKYKWERRRQLTQEGRIIAGTVGDQWSDLCGGYAGYQVKLPNLMYELL